MAERLRRGLGLRRGSAAPEPAAEPRPVEPAPPPRSSAPAAALRGLGEPPSASSRDQADEAELDTLRGELVRELDRMAEGDDGSAAFRRIAS
jgi:hypothetical protein